MVLAIICAAFCLAATTLMYTPRMRLFRYYRPVALFFLFEGIWIIADYACSQFAPGNVVLPIIHYIGIIAVVIYFIISILVSSDKKIKKPPKTAQSKKIVKKDS